MQGKRCQPIPGFPHPTQAGGASTGGGGSPPPPMLGPSHRGVGERQADFGVIAALVGVEHLEVVAQEPVQGYEYRERLLAVEVVRLREQMHGPDSPETNVARSRFHVFLEDHPRERR